MNFPLARDQQGNPFTLPSDAAYWRVRRHTGGRPSTVLGPDGEPLFVGITSDRSELQAYGCNGSVRLEAVDGDYRSVRAPVGYVEFAPNGAGDSLRKTDTQSDSPELVRAAVESLTRTMEAMQRSQVERERAIGQREKAVTDAQIEMQRSHTQLIVALMDKATGGQPQDPLTLIQNQEKINKALEASARKYRNGGHVEIQAASELPVVVPETGAQTVMKSARHGCALRAAACRAVREYDRESPQGCWPAPQRRHRREHDERRGCWNGRRWTCSRTGVRAATARPRSHDRR
jgi:hypothetical protein